MKKSEEDYYKKAHARLKEEGDKLAAIPEFQKDIAVLRKKWNIPEGGYKEGSEVSEWHHWLSEQDSLWYQNEWWPKHVPKLKVLEGDPTKIREYRDEKERLWNTQPINAFFQDVGAILVKYKLRPSWKEAIRSYALLNYFSSWLGVVISPVEDSLTGFQEIHIIINENTTLKDIEAAWPRIMFFQNEMPYRKSQKRQPYKNLERNKRAYELTEEGLSAKDAAERLGEELGEIYGYSDIYYFVRRHKQKFDIS